jgi:hypothetical protein
MVHRTNPNMPADSVFTRNEIAVLNHLSGHSNQTAPRNVAHYLQRVAQLGGHLNRKNDGPPGNTVIWRGITRLTDIQLGMQIGLKLVGN